MRNFDGIKIQNLIIIFLIIIYLFATEKIKAKNLNSKDTSFYEINAILISGNKITKDRIIKRELIFEEGDSICNKFIDSLLFLSQRNIFNTSLFLEVDVYKTFLEGRRINIHINVKERWYIFLSPIFELADRNFNEWWFKHAHQLDRVEYGGNFTYANLWGLKHLLGLFTQFGYSNKYMFLYKMPEIDKKGKLGALVLMDFNRNKEIAYGINQKNELVFHKNFDEYVRKRLFLKLSFFYREHIKKRHNLSISYSNNYISDSIYHLNNDYLGKNQQSQEFFRIHYEYTNNHTDIHYYPTKGFFFNFTFDKYGLGIFSSFNMIKLGFTLKKYTNFNRINFDSKVSFYFSQYSDFSYLNALNMGYGENFVRGYQYYVQKGRSNIISRNSLKYNLLESKIKLKYFKKLSKFNTIPFKLNLKLFADCGYMYSDFEQKYNQDNKLLLGYGLGLDFVTYYDIVFRVEYSFNILKEQNLFFNFRKAI